MSKINFEIDKENNLSAKGNLLSAINFAGGKDLVGCLKCAFEVYKEIENVYIKAMANDMKIVGSERSDILLQIDLFFNLIVLLWVLVSNEHDDQQIILINDRMSGTMLNITINHEQWVASGHVSDLILKPSPDFHTAYREELSPAVKHFLADYKKSVEDGVLDENERKQLKEDINDILYTSIYLRFQVSHCIVSN